MLTSLISLLPLLSLFTPTSASPFPTTHDITKRYTGVRIQSRADGLCLHPTGSTSAWGDGTPVGVTDCWKAATWSVDPGVGSILTEEGSWALDAGTGTQDHEGVKLWTSYTGLFQQTWNFTGDGHIRIAGGNQSLAEGSNGPETFTYGQIEDNQIWYIVNVIPASRAASAGTEDGEGSTIETLYPSPTAV
ncbi:hypothetical protein IAT38_001928 [Cryptococcus sp. DSM 104549]